MQIFQSMNRLEKTSLLICIYIFFFISCTNSTGLEPVSGVEGTLTFYGEWDPEIQAAAMIALDGLDLENPAAHLVTYSNLIETGVTEADFFIQLLPGTYYLATVGITVDPGFFVAKLDSFLTADEIPLKIIDSDLRNLTTPFTVNYQTITQVDRGIIF